MADGLATPAIESMSDEEHKARFARLVREHHKLVWRSARWLGTPPADVDDVVQDVFLQAARKLEEIRDERAYLFRTCVYVVGQLRRSARRRRRLQEDECIRAVRAEWETPEECAEAAQARAQLQAILDDMPDDLRTAFVLFELEQFTTSQIATITGAPMGTVASRLRRAREIFLSRASVLGRGER
ncbi:RNA polymerase sigma factor [Labilithrix luteola]|uniref:RNA polymerase sigma factor n=1 Tax=Labilithrix luteola TaxID=1391654 RepID=UPI001473FAF4|nr:sigma-70 family RNA polymerase sigma factor [Labilithrix luteola]